jgi:hypothetical protein
MDAHLAAQQAHLKIPPQQEMLEQANKRVAVGELLLGRQLTLVSQLEQKGRPTDVARALLIMAVPLRLCDDDGGDEHEDRSDENDGQCVPHSGP